MSAERGIVFRCAGARLVGVLHEAPQAARLGVLIVVGGPQYRVGSHRQFLLLARSLAAAGIPAMRFDYRGMGDSEGDFAGFEGIDADIAAALDAFAAESPGIERIVLWGLCDAASAILFYAHRDPRVAGIALLNPWVRTEAGFAKAQIRHYYGARLFERAFWARLARGEVRLGAALGGLAAALARAAGGGRADPAAAEDATPLPERMAQGLERFGGPALLVISGRDLTAREFEDDAAASPLWRRLLAAETLTRRDLPAADHTFSRQAWREQVAAWTVEWVRGLGSADPIRQAPN